MKRIELGCPGHLIDARHCHFRRHTQVGRYRVSTVGNYNPYPPGSDHKRATLGVGKADFFETMVFRTTGKPESNNEGCGCEAVADWCEIDSKRYATAGDAQQGHERMVRKYARRVKL